jgi:hypothetical protein
MPRFMGASDPHVLGQMEAFCGFSALSVLCGVKGGDIAAPSMHHTKIHQSKWIWTGRLSTSS